MPDLEKVSKGLCDAIGLIHGYIPKRYWGYGEQACRDAITLLKEKEPVEPEVYYVGTDKYKFYRCPVCKIDWHYKGNYCLGCGRAVKWND